MDLSLSGKVALVAGASRGIGRATAFSLAREGARLFLVARGAEDLQRTAEQLGAEGATVASATFDLSTEDGATRAVKGAVDAFGGLDVLINNAGGSGGSGAFDVATAAQWRSVIDQNLMSAVWCSQAAVAFMREHGGGAIVHISSICGREYCTSAPYTAAKAALGGLTKEMAIDLARFGIRVNAVAPGSILFPGGSWARRQEKDPARIAEMVERELPWKRFGRPEEVADAVCFVASPRASWMSGSCVVVDGGQGRAF
jgi:3-oxoacyl-[acyl-carrier protein] reductase